MPETQPSPDAASEPQPQANKVANAAGKGCVTMLIVGAIALWALVQWIGGPDYNAIAQTQAAALALESAEMTEDGLVLLSQQVRVQPEDNREEYVRQLVDLWFNIDAPLRFPTEGQDAGWLQDDSARRAVKRKMIEQILAAASAE